MNSHCNQILQLRQLLREQFPESHRTPLAVPEPEPEPEPEPSIPHTPSPNTPESLLSGIPAIDRIGIPRACITEIVAERLPSGGSLILTSLIRQAAARDEYLALIDGRDSFDPLDLEPETRRRLFWTRCQSAEHAIKAADLLLRDGNLPNVALDLQLNDRREIRALPSSCWYRLRNLIEQSGATLVLFTPCQTAPSAHLRFALERRFRLDAMDELRRDLEQLVKVRVTRDRARVKSDFSFNEARRSA